MNILKSDLKILISLLPLSFIISCTTVELTSYSEEFIEKPFKTQNEYDLAIISVSEMEDIRYSDEFSTISYTPYNEELYMPVPDFSPLERPQYVSGYTSYSVDEFRLTPLTFVKLIKPKVENKIVVAEKTTTPEPKKDTVITPTKKIEKNITQPAPKVVAVKTVETPEVIETKTVKKAEPVKPKTTPVKKVTAIQKKIEPTPIKYIELGDMEVVVNKSFTVEMDQSGWLFEKSLDDIRFKNKFYTNSSVLFEFIADSVGDYTLEFSKYRGEEVLYSKILISVVETQSIKEVFKTTNDGVLITPEEVTEYLTEKELLEKDLLNIKNHKNPDEVYFKLAEIYYDEGLLRKAKEFYEYIYDNYPFSIYYTQAEERMSYIINNFLKVR